MISWVWITTLLNWAKMELKGESRRGAETWARSYQKIRAGPSLLLHGSEYVHLRPFLYILTFTYLFLLPVLSSFHSTTLSASLSSLSSCSVYLYTVPPNSTDTEELIVLRLVPKLPLWLEFMNVCYWAHIMSQMNSINMLMPYIHKIHSNIIFSPSLCPTGGGF